MSAWQLILRIGLVALLFILLRRRLKVWAAWIAGRLKKFRKIARILLVCRFSLISLLVVGAALLVTGEGQDLVRLVAEFAATPSTRGVFWWSLGFSVLWGAELWYWSRVLLLFNFHRKTDAPNQLNPLIAWYPRILGALGYAVLAAAFWRASAAYSASLPVAFAPGPVLRVTAAAFLTLAILFPAALANRRRLLLFVVSLLRKWQHRELTEQTVTRLMKPWENPRTKLRELPAGTRIALAVHVLAALALVVAAMLTPSGVGSNLGSVAIILFASIAWLVFGSALVYLGEKRRFPILAFLALWVFVCTYWNENHLLRSIGDAAPARPSIEEIGQRWRGSLTSICFAHQRHPVVIVAAEGGGIRAAYWSAAVLTQLQEENPYFGTHLFALSGVSGGSLGAAVYASLLVEGVSDPEMVSRAQSVLGSDFLSPTLAAMLFPDVLQLFSPWPFQHDRAYALEEAWASAWARQKWPQPETSERFQKNFLSLWERRGGANRTPPSLFLNGTEVEDGRRLIASNATVRGSFGDAEGTLDFVEGDLSLVTAVHSSARFTYVSPAATVRHHDGSVAGHIVDGGYFENSGCTTASEILSALWGEPNVPHPMNRDFFPVVVVIDHLEPPGPPPSTHGLITEVAAPVEALLAAREGHGRSAQAELCARAKSLGGECVEFRLEGLRVPVPLGWSLSHLVQAEIDGCFDPSSDKQNRPGAGCFVRTRDKLARLETLLGPNE
jgi:predicted acylesterase/phospholipase RssA